MTRARIVAIGIALVWLATMYALADARMDQLAPEAGAEAGAR